VYHEGAEMAKRTPENDLIFKIDAFTPDTLPFNVFAEYISSLVALLGDTHDIHFVRVGKGSAKLIQRVKQHAIKTVRERVESVKQRKGPEEALSAFSRVNALLVRDNAVATLSLGRDKLIEFPGRKNKPEPPLGPITQPDYLDGQLIRAGGKDATVPIQLRDEEGTIYYCTANVNIARELGPYLYRQSIRVYGTGYWYRHSDGQWILDFFRIDRFDALDDTPLSEAVETLRHIADDDWPHNIEKKLEELRPEE
jgi:hypothetical protein